MKENPYCARRGLLRAVRNLFAGEYDFLSINKKDVVLGVGANIGDFAVLASLKVNKAIAIEPTQILSVYF